MLPSLTPFVLSACFLPLCLDLFFSCGKFSAAPFGVIVMTALDQKMGVDALSCTFPPLFCMFGSLSHALYPFFSCRRRGEGELPRLPQTVFVGATQQKHQVRIRERKLWFRFNFQRSILTGVLSGTHCVNGACGLLLLRFKNLFGCSAATFM